MLEFLAEINQGEESRRRGVAYLKQTQEADGAWYGRWGVNYLYGTGLALSGLRAAGEDMGQAYIRRAVEWLLGRQNPDGGWGESCMTYIDPGLRGQGKSTASQTAWVLQGLIAAGEAADPRVQAGVRYLLEHRPGTGTGSSRNTPGRVSHAFFTCATIFTGFISRCSRWRGI